MEKMEKVKREDLPEEVIRALDLYEEHMKGETDAFWTSIFDAMMAANKKQLEQLETIYHDEVYAYRLYMSGKLEHKDKHKPVPSKSATEEARETGLLGGKK